MGTSIRVMPLKWVPLVLGRDVGRPDFRAGERIMARASKVFRSWERTPYIAGQAQKGVGVDCVRFWSGVLDEMYGYERVPLDRKPQDLAMHTREGAMGVMREMMRVYPELEPVTDGTVEPLDTIVVGHRDGGCGHVLLAGTQRNTLWHAGMERVCRTGWGLDGEWQVIKHVYRARNRRMWDLDVAMEQRWLDRGTSESQRRAA